MKCLIYPCSNEFHHLIELINNCDNELNIVKAVCPKIVRDQIADDFPCDVVTDFDIASEEIECIIICDTIYNGNMYGDIVNKICTSIENDKKVICCSEINDIDLERIYSLKESEKRFAYFGGCYKNYSKDVFIYEKQECIVIGIGKLFSKLDAKKEFCQLIRKFSDEGYKTVGVSLDKNSVLYGGFVIPDHVFTDIISSDLRVIYLNKFINDIQQKCCPDIILIEFPDGMMKLSDSLGDGYGIKPFLLSQAVSVDYFILDIPTGFIDPKRIENVSNEISVRYGFDVNAIIINNYMIDYYLSIQYDEIEMFSSTPEAVDDYKQQCMQEYSDCIFVSQDSTDEVDVIVSSCIEALSDNVEEL